MVEWGCLVSSGVGDRKSIQSFADYLLGKYYGIFQANFSSVVYLLSLKNITDLDHIYIDVYI